MLRIPSLTNIILLKYSISQLYDIYRQTGLVDIEREIGRRLSMYDVLTIEFLYNIHIRNQQDKLLQSVYVRDGFINALRTVPWKIGIIYNYRKSFFEFNNMEIILGKSRALKTNDNKYFHPTWLDANRTGLILREVVSRNIPISNGRTSRHVSDDLDSTIRNILINNLNVGLSLCMFPPQTNSFDQPLPYGEKKEMWPCILSANYQLIGGNPLLMQDFNVTVTHTDDYQKLLVLLNR